MNAIVFVLGNLLQVNGLVEVFVQTLLPHALLEVLFDKLIELLLGEGYRGHQSDLLVLGLLDFFVRHWSRLLPAVGLFSILALAQLLALVLRDAGVSQGVLFEFVLFSELDFHLTRRLGQLLLLLGLMDEFRGVLLDFLQNVFPL